MNALATIESRLPDWAKDARPNLDSTLARSSLTPRIAAETALAASIVDKCEFCVASHAKLLRDTGMTTDALRDIGRIAAAVHAAAQVLAMPAATREPARAAA